MEKTMKKVKITDNYEKLIYDEELAFLCMQTYLEHFVNMFAFEGIVLLLDQVQKAKHDVTDILWQEWIQSIKHVLRGTHELDVFYDPFTCEKM
jgi:hypothetical protein